MKKSIFKKLVSVVSVLAMTVTCTATAFAAYECASQNTNFSDGAVWDIYKSQGSPGSSITLENGVLKSERSIFKTTSTDCGKYGLTAVTSGEGTNVNGSDMWYQANADGTAWEAIPNPPSYGSTGTHYAVYKFDDGASFAKGTVQTKFDFMFEGESNQCIAVGFRDSTTTGGDKCVGVRIYRNMAGFWLPKNVDTGDIKYGEDNPRLPADKWFTATMTYNMDTKVISFAIKSRDDDSFSVSKSHSLDNESDWKMGSTVYQPGAVTGVQFLSYRGFDQSVVSEVPNPATSVWYVDNVEIDAGVGYKAENVYSSGDGITANTPGIGVDFDGIKLSRLTKIADPANVSFITALYAGDGRMESVAATPLSEVGTTPIHSTITGENVKSFVMGMDSAKPYMAPYTYVAPEETIRSINFDGEYPESIKTMSSLKTEFTHGKSSARGLNMSIVSENGNKVLKSERTNFRVTGTTTALGNVYYCYNPDTKAFEMVKGDTDTGYYYIDLGKSVTDLRGSFRFKFAGSNYETTYQEIEFNINAGPTSSSVSEYFIRISRDETGAGGIKSGFGGNTTSWTNMNAGEWYTCNFTCKDGKLTATVTGRFGNSSEITTTKATPQDLYKKEAFQRIGVGSHRDQDKVIGYSKVDSANLLTDYIVKEAAKEGENNTSVWYIDDIKFEY